MIKKANRTTKAAVRDQEVKKSAPLSPAKPTDPAKGATAEKPSAASASSEGPRSTPRAWEEIQVGSLVLAQESLDAGWWEALVVTINPGILTLRWRDYPRLPAINRSRAQIGFLAAEK